MFASEPLLIVNPIFPFAPGKAACAGETSASVTARTSAKGTSRICTQMSVSRRNTPPEPLSVAESAEPVEASRKRPPALGLEVVNAPFDETKRDLPPNKVAEMVESGEAQLIDVREPYEWEAGHIAGATHIELERLAGRAGEIDK